MRPIGAGPPRAGHPRSAGCGGGVSSWRDRPARPRAHTHGLSPPSPRNACDAVATSPVRRRGEECTCTGRFSTRCPIRWDPRRSSPFCRSWRDLSQMVGRQCPELALLVPSILIAMVDGRRGLREAWPAALTSGGAFAMFGTAVTGSDTSTKLPDRGEVTMTVPFMRAYTELLAATCHRRGAPAMGGMAALIPSRRDEEANERALAGVRADKEREVGRPPRSRAPRSGSGSTRRGARRRAHRDPRAGARRDRRGDGPDPRAGRRGDLEGGSARRDARDLRARRALARAGRVPDAGGVRVSGSSRARLLTRARQPVSPPAAAAGTRSA